MPLLHFRNRREHNFAAERFGGTQPEPSRASWVRKLRFKFDFAQSPFFGEDRFPGAVGAQESLLFVRFRDCVEGC